jgi:hypothetical protein
MRKIKKKKFTKNRAVREEKVHEKRRTKWQDVR